MCTVALPPAAFSLDVEGDEVAARKGTGQNDFEMLQPNRKTEVKYSPYTRGALKMLLVFTILFAKFASMMTFVSMWVPC